MSETPYSETSSDNINSRRSSISECLSNVDSTHSCNESSQHTALELHIPIYIETLTGTTFELQVFPNDTISNIKLKLENMEGIPMARQHLIWQGQELRNEFTVEDYGIAFGTILRLVIAIRGGPIAKSPTFFDIDSDTEEKIGDSNDCQSRPLTVLVFHNGDQIKMFTISSNDDTDSVRDYDQISDKNIGSANSSNNSEHGVKEKNELKQKEDEITKAKMKELQERLKILQLKRINKTNKKKIDDKLNNSQESKKFPNKLPLLEKVLNNNLEVNTKQKQCNSSLYLPPISAKQNSCDDKVKYAKSRNSSDKPTSFRHSLLQSKSIDTYLFKRCLSLSPNTEINSRIATVNKHLLSNIHLRDNNKNNFFLKLDGMPANIKKLDNQRPHTTPQLNANNKLIFITANDFNCDATLNRKQLLLTHKLGNKDITKSLKPNPSQKLPPIKTTKAKKVNSTRCSVCRIKLGISMRFTCRCGLIFCGKHRYSEVHNCSYDYKAEGKKYLKMSNPLFTSSKLPKI